MSRWFRLYDDVVNDPKIIKLSDEIFRVWVNLLCIASKNSGVLPPTDDLAIMLRIKVHKVAAVIARLVQLGLLDRTDAGFAPHNWNARQYRTDATDPTAASRAKRYRDRKRDATVMQGVTDKRPESETDAEQIDVLEARAPERPPAGSLISAAAFSLAASVLQAMDVDPGGAIAVGAPFTVQAWLNGGWPADAILTGVQRAMAGRKGDPPGSLKYFEKPIARAHAELRRDLPKAAPKAEPSEARRGAHHNRSGGSLVAAIKRELAELEGAQGADPALPDGAVLRLPH